MLINLKAMNYKKRKSNSVEYPSLVEYLQAGILIRFNVSKVIPETDEELESHDYDEFWFPENASIEEIEAALQDEGFELSEEQRGLIV